MYESNQLQRRRLSLAAIARLTAWWRNWNERQLAVGASTFQKLVDPLNGRTLPTYYSSSRYYY